MDAWLFTHQNGPPYICLMERNEYASMGNSFFGSMEFVTLTHSGIYISIS